MNDSPHAAAGPFFLGLLCRRVGVRLTLRGRLLIILLAILVGTGLVRGVHGFLAVQDPVPGGVLVVEGWAPDVVVAQAAAEWEKGGYSVFCVTGEPLEKGAVLIDYRDYAALTVAAFEKAGGTPGLLQPVPWETVRRDRTYASALALKAWLAERKVPASKVHVVTTGLHARRSRLLYAKAFGPATRIGVMAAPERSFDPEHWWTSSAGVRSVVDEGVAYIYARCFFRGR